VVKYSTTVHRFLAKESRLSKKLWMPRGICERNTTTSTTTSFILAAWLIKIRVQLQLLFCQGYEGFLTQDRLLFSKPKHILLQGTLIKMLQWITSVLNATGRTTQATDDLEATMHSKQALMKFWLTDSSRPPPYQWITHISKL
jgi:hypothetical protein